MKKTFVPIICTLTHLLFSHPGCAQDFHCKEDLTDLAQQIRALSKSKKIPLRSYISLPENSAPTPITIKQMGPFLQYFLPKGRVLHQYDLGTTNILFTVLLRGKDKWEFDVSATKLDFPPHYGHFALNSSTARVSVPQQTDTKTFRYIHRFQVIEFDNGTTILVEVWNYKKGHRSVQSLSAFVPSDAQSPRAIQSTIAMDPKEKPPTLTFRLQ